MKEAAKNIEDGANLIREVESDILVIVLDMLRSPKVQDTSPRLAELRADPQFEMLYNVLIDLRELSASLSRGELHKFVFNKGFVLSNLKALQSNLRHLTWQTQRIAEGDLSQKVDFLGDFSTSFNLMTEKLSEATKNLIDQANVDSLTSAPNRLALTQFLESEFQTCVAHDRPLSVMIFDLDRFKSVNDNYGHAAGDVVLKEAVRILGATFRTSDVFGRYGGEEFLAALPHTDASRAVIVADRARAALENSVIDIGGGQTISVTVSVGVAERVAEDADYESVVRRSDEALYISKNSGRNRVTLG